MSAANQLQRDISPYVLADTSDLSREEWLEFRRRGIGGSDVAVLMGISPFWTARDLYYDKLKIAPLEPDESNWVAMEMGNLLEELVSRIFAKKTGYEVFKVKKMFYHPQYPFMLADVDYFVQLPDGSIAILEIKTTNYNARDNWWKNGQESVPVYYECQGRQYMAVTNLDRVFFCCLYGNSEDEVIIREIRRDPDYEEEMIFLETEFWDNHVMKKTPPPYTEDGDLILKSVRQYTGKADESAEKITMDNSTAAVLSRYMELQKEKETSERQLKKLQKEMERLKAMLVAEMGQRCTAVCEVGSASYTITYNPVRKPIIEKDNLFRLKLQYPELYEEFVTISEYRRFQVKVSAAPAA